MKFPPRCIWEFIELNGKVHTTATKKKLVEKYGIRPTPKHSAIQVVDFILEAYPKRISVSWNTRTRHPKDSNLGIFSPTKWWAFLYERIHSEIEKHGKDYVRTNYRKRTELKPAGGLSRKDVLTMAITIYPNILAQSEREYIDFNKPHVEQIVRHLYSITPPPEQNNALLVY